MWSAGTYYYYHLDLSLDFCCYLLEHMTSFFDIEEIVIKDNLCVRLEHMFSFDEPISCDKNELKIKNVRKC